MLTLEHRAFFQQLCGVLLPAWEGLPDGSTLQLQDALLDAVLDVRPDLMEPLRHFTHKFADEVGKKQVVKMCEEFPDEFTLLKLLVCAAYFQHSEVKSALNYHGQQALTLPRGGFGCEELVLKMMSGAKRYRDTDAR